MRQGANVRIKLQKPVVNWHNLPRLSAPQHHLSNDYRVRICLVSPGEIPAVALGPHEKAALKVASGSAARGRIAARQRGVCKKSEGINIIVVYEWNWIAGEPVRKLDQHQFKFPIAIF